MRKVFKGNRKEQRNIITDARHIRFEELDIDVYIKNDKHPQYPFVVQIFEGNKAKPSKLSRYRTMGLAEAVISERVKLVQTKLDYKVKQKAQRKIKLEILKKGLTPGTIVRTSFSYNMTFNKFYTVISNKRNTYTLEALQTEWVDGDFGWTGNVKAGKPTGKIIEGKLTATGLKIDRLYGHIIKADDTFYENHLD